MDHEEIPETLGADVHGLLGTASADVDFETDVVPGVLAGYRRHVRVRRWQAAGGALAAVAIAAAGIGALHGWAVGRSATPAVYPTGDFANVGCTQHWATYPHGQGPMIPDPAGRSAEERVFCQALTDAVLAGAPLGTTFSALPLPPDLKTDPHLDQARYARYEALLTAGKVDDGLVPTGYMDMLIAVDAEYTRLARHPEDPLNEADGTQYSLGTPTGTTDVTIMIDTLPPAAPGTASDDWCRGLPPGSQCTEVTVGAWHGSVSIDPPDAGGWVHAGTNLSDGKGHLFSLTTRGYDSAGWRGLPMSASDAKHLFWNGAKWVADDVWTDLHTGRKVTSVGPPPTPALTMRQWTTMIQTPAFAAFLEHALPAYQGWTK